MTVIIDHAALPPQQQIEARSPWLPVTCGPEEESVIVTISVEKLRHPRGLSAVRPRRPRAGEG